jgi:hypothetical protein
MHTSFCQKTRQLRGIHRWEDNIKIDLGGTGYEDVDCVHLVHTRTSAVPWWALVNTVIKLWILCKGGEFCD